MKKAWYGVALIVGCMIGWTVVPATGALDEDFAIDEAEATVITSSRLTFDQEQRFALFEEDVLVVDPSLRLTADRLTVVFDENDQAETIEAEGDVVIEQEGTTAWSQKATYEVPSGKIFLEGAPRIRRGRDVLEGDTITFWRDDNRMICEPQARLVLFPDDGEPGSGARGLMFGE